MKYSISILMAAGLLSAPTFAGENPTPISLAGYPPRNAEDAAQSPAALFHFFAHRWEDDTRKWVFTTREELRAILAEKLALRGRPREAWDIFRAGLKGKEMGPHNLRPFRQFTFQFKENQPSWKRAGPYAFQMLPDVFRSQAFKNDLKFRKMVWKDVKQFINTHPDQKDNWEMLTPHLIGKFDDLAREAGRQHKEAPKRKVMWFHARGTIHLTVGGKLAHRELDQLISSGNANRVRERFNQLKPEAQSEVAKLFSIRLAKEKLPKDALYLQMFIPEEKHPIFALFDIAEHLHKAHLKPDAFRALHRAQQALELLEGKNELLKLRLAEGFANLGDLKTAEAMAPHTLYPANIYFLLAENYEARANHTTACQMLDIAARQKLSNYEKLELSRHWRAIHEPRRADAILQNWARQILDPDQNAEDVNFGYGLALVEEFHAAGDKQRALQMLEKLALFAEKLESNRKRISQFPDIIGLFFEYDQFRQTAHWTEVLMDIHWEWVEDKSEDVLFGGNEKNLFPETGFYFGSCRNHFSTSIKHHRWPAGHTQRHHWWSAANLGQLSNILNANTLPRLRKVLPHLKNKRHREWLITAAILQSKGYSSTGLGIDEKQFAQVRPWLPLLPDPKHRAQITELIEYLNVCEFASSWSRPSKQKLLAKTARLNNPEWRTIALRKASSSLLYGDPAGARDLFASALAAAQKIPDRGKRIEQLQEIAQLASSLDLPLAGRETLSCLLRDTLQLPAKQRPHHLARIAAAASALQQAETFHRALGEIQSAPLCRGAILSAAMELCLQHPKSLKPTFNPHEQKMAQAILSAWEAMEKSAKPKR